MREIFCSSSASLKDSLNQGLVLVLLLIVLSGLLPFITVNNEIVNIGSIEVPVDTSLKLFFDIEGDSFLDVEYLFGFWVSGDPKSLYYTGDNVRYYEIDSKYFVYFMAEKPEDEREMWESFIKWIDALPQEYYVYHFACYEKIQIRKLAEKYGGSIALQEFQNKLVDLRPIIENAIVFPIYFYSIKDIAKYLSFNWRHQKASGSQSILWYEKWLETGDINVLKDIIDYNEDDVQATEFVLHWLKKHKEQHE